MADDTTLAFTALGPLRGWRGSHELALGSPQQRAALAMLLLRGERPVDIDDLVLGLWGNDAPKAATGAVRTYISRLRTLLEPEHRSMGGPSLLVSVGTSYALRLPGGAVDIDLVEQELTAATTARKAGELVRAHEQLASAAGRWRGIPLTGLTGPFADNQREHLPQRRLSVLEQRIEFDLERSSGRRINAAADPSAERTQSRTAQA
ncbi:MAG TPA: BTAD domain-containing putative transcriptional regulator [Jatrophihabitans sp.]|jgi:DNA-binding SARP family transcriptional activator